MTFPDDLRPYETPLVACPACGYAANFGTCITGDGTLRPVRPGDISICVVCAVFVVYVDGLQLRLLTDGEWLQMPAPKRRYLTHVRDMLTAVKKEERNT